MVWGRGEVCAVVEVGCEVVFLAFAEGAEVGFEGKLWEGWRVGVEVGLWY